MKSLRAILLALISVHLLTLAPTTARAEDDTPPKEWSFDASLYLLLSGMSGTITSLGQEIDLKVSFSEILANLQMAALGNVRANYGRWAVSTDVIYLSLGANKNNSSADLNTWIVEPTVEYRVSPKVALLAGARYYSMSGEVSVPKVGGEERNGTGTISWWDPVVGGLLTLPFAQSFAFNLRADVGGFGAGSDFAWQVFPFVVYDVSHTVSVGGGYRWLSMDYASDPPEVFAIDAVIQGPQLGVIFHF